MITPSIPFQKIILINIGDLFEYKQKLSYYFQRVF